ncbi:MAG: hypothetical protein ACRD6W_04165, partial [Nitrososphaerales archaeon]
MSSLVMHRYAVRLTRDRLEREILRFKDLGFTIHHPTTGQVRYGGDTVETAGEEYMLDPEEWMARLVEGTISNFDLWLTDSEWKDLHCGVSHSESTTRWSYYIDGFSAEERTRVKAALVAVALSEPAGTRAIVLDTWAPEGEIAAFVERRVGEPPESVVFAMVRVEPPTTDGQPGA